MAASGIPDQLFTKIRQVQATFDATWTQLAVEAMASKGEAAWRMLLSLPDDEAKQLLDVYISSGGAGAGAGATAGPLTSGDGPSTSSAGPSVLSIGPAHAAVSQVEYLRRPVVCRPHENRPSSSTSAGAGQRFHIKPWVLSLDDCTRITTTVATMLHGKTIIQQNPADAGYLEGATSSEAETNLLFYCDILKRLQAVHHVNGKHLFWRLEPATSVNSNTVPDFVLELRENNVCTVIMVGEGKYPVVLTATKLANACNAVWQGTARHGRGETQSACSAVNQACNYMLERNLRYGFLTTGTQYTYFIRYGAPWTYEITEAFTSGTHDPTIGEMLYYVTKLALEEGLVTDPAGMAGSAGPFERSTQTFAQGSASGADPGPGPSSEQTAVGRRPGLRRAQGGAGGGSNRSCTVIPDGDLVFDKTLGHGMCGISSLGRYRGRLAVIKSVDAHNSSHLIPHLQHEADVLSGPLAILQGDCVSELQACGYAMGGSIFVLVKSFITGRHPRAGSESIEVLKAAAQVLHAIHKHGVAHGDISKSNILIDGVGKVHFIDFGQSILHPTEAQCEKEQQQLRELFAASSPDSVLAEE